MVEVASIEDCMGIANDVDVFSRVLMKSREDRVFTSECDFAFERVEEALEELYDELSKMTVIEGVDD